MNDRKKKVVKVSHQLFIEKGFQTTSIQDILDQSGISKGTFYKYFSSKNELFITLFKMIYQENEKNRNDLLIGQDPTNIDMFIKQIELQMKLNKINKLIKLYEDVIFSNDTDLKQFVREWQMKETQWVYRRFIDLFGENKRPYLLDASIMFSGILHNNIRFHIRLYGTDVNLNPVIRYSVERISKIVDEIAASQVILIHPEVLEDLLVNDDDKEQAFREKLKRTITALKKNLKVQEEQIQYIELLDFILDEFQHSMTPRKFLLDSALLSLKSAELIFSKREIKELTDLLDDYFES